MSKYPFTCTIPVLFAVVISGCDHSPAVSQNNSNRPETAGQSEPIITPIPLASAIAFGKVGTSGGVEFTITKLSTKNKVGSGSSSPTAEPGEVFVIVDYTLKNVADAPLASNDRPKLTLLDNRGRAYAPDDAASFSAGLVWGEDSSGYSSNLNPNVSARTRAAWKLDKASFNRGNWRLALATTPQLTFKLQ